MAHQIANGYPNNENGYSELPCLSNLSESAYAGAPHPLLNFPEPSTLNSKAAAKGLLEARHLASMPNQPCTPPHNAKFLQSTNSHLTIVLGTAVMPPWLWLSGSSKLLQQCRTSLVVSHGASLAAMDKSPLFYLPGLYSNAQ